MKESHGFGLEIESLRITPEGTLSLRPHPYDSPYIDRDFCEAQLEIITPVCFDIPSLMESVNHLFQQVALHLDGETLWPFSNPPVVDESRIIPAQYEGPLKEKTHYREYLAEKYGKQKMLFCGIHFNYSLSTPFATTENYLHLAAETAAYAWLIVALMGASPAGPYASVRNSPQGYWNMFMPVISFTSLDAHIASIQTYVDQGLLYNNHELYYPVRLKPRGANTLTALSKGVSHIELRMIDLNPLSALRIKEEDIAFLELFLIYLLQRDSTRVRPEDIIHNIYAASMLDLEHQTITLDRPYALVPCALSFLQDMERWHPDGAIRYQIRKLTNPHARYSYQIINKQRHKKAHL